MQPGSNTQDLVDQLAPVLLPALLTLIISVFICAALVRLRRQRLLDIPVERSAHTAATPRGGGVAIAVSLLIFLLALYLQGLINGLALAVLLCAYPVAVTGFFDDLYNLPVHVRLPLHLTAALVALLLLGPVPEPFLSGWLPLPGWSKSLLLMIALVWLLNLYNFMDGIDTLAASQCLFMCASSGFFLWSAGDSIAWVCLGLFVATLGFLVWNIPPARLFMGDVGSTFIGFFLGLLGLLTHYAGSLSVWVWVLLMGSFIADTTFTLLRRRVLGYSLTQGHSTHAYQHLARRLGGHRRVALIYTAVNVLWCLPMAWLAVVYPHYGVVLAFAGIVPLMAAAALLGAGLKDNK